MVHQVFINTDTFEYPRHAGDIELNPTANWEPVIQTPAPDIEKGWLAEELPPIQINNIWTAQWTTRVMTQEELELNISNAEYFFKANGYPQEDIDRIISGYR